jgi:hypothetical protein
VGGVFGDVHHQVMGAFKLWNDAQHRDQEAVVRGYGRLQRQQTVDQAFKFGEVPPRPEMVALVEEIRRLLGMEGPVEIDPPTPYKRTKVINRANMRALKEQGDHPASEMP